MPLQRVLEPEMMDSVDEATAYDSMDHSAVNQMFVDDLLAVQPNPGDTLDLGTGTAQIPVVLCRAHKTCRVLAVDAAVAMLELARYNVEAAGLIHRVQLAQVDAKSLPFEDGMFETVVSNSIVHHVPQPAEVLAEAVRVTAAGGRLFFRDLLRPANNESLAALVDTYAATCNDHQRRMFAESLHAALDLAEIRGLVAQLGFDPATVNQTSDRHWTWSAVKPE
jgi:ubiquinone/menaquinone biosynthesis C-methylase UbiE